MDVALRRFLISQIDNVRLGPRDEVIPMQGWFALAAREFRAQLNGFNAMGLLSVAEIEEWSKRMATAINLRRFGATSARTERSWSLDWNDSRQPAVAQFLFLVPGSNPVPAEAGGLFQVLSLEIYDRLVAVNWRLAPLPNTEVAYSEELAQLEKDSRDLSDDDRRILRAQLINRLKTTRWFNVKLSDDSGYRFKNVGGSINGTPGERLGKTRFEPTPAAGATRLVVQFGAQSSEIHIPIRRALL